VPGINRRESPGNPARVAFLLPNLESGGTERHVLSLARLLDRSRFSLSLFTTAGGGSLHGEFSTLLPVTVFGDPSQGRRFRTGPVEHLRTIGRLAAMFRKDRPDILHAYLPAANVIGPIAARIAGVPNVIVSKRALANYKENFPLLRKVEPLGNRLSDVILVNSDAVRRDVERTEKHWEGKFRKIYNGVTPIAPWTEEERRAFRAREGIPAGARIVLCVSNFYPYKGHAELVDAVSRVVPASPDALFLLVGRDAGTLEASRTLARKNGVEGNIRFLGNRTDVPDLLRACDLFVHPSREEGFSNAILEAMAAGRVVVAVDVGGNPEAVEDGRTGVLVPSRDPGLLAEAILGRLSDPEGTTEMGDSGRRRAGEHFSLDRMVREMEELYDSLLKAGS
jgi:glycosyltransferase involved in cell wall biosynthesis